MDQPRYVREEGITRGVVTNAAIKAPGQCSDQGTGRDQGHAGLRLFLKAVRLIALPHAQVCAWSQARHVRHLRWCSSAEQPQC